MAVFAQGPIGLCATAGAKLMGATTIIAVDTVPERLEVARRLGADHVVDFRAVNPVDAIMELTDGRGVDVAIEALGTQATFEAALRVLRPGGTLSSLGVYSTDLTHPARRLRGRPRRPPHRHHALPRRQGADAAADGRDRRRPRRPPPLVTHRFKLDQIEEAYDLFSHQRDGVLKVAITPCLARPAVSPLVSTRVWPGKVLALSGPISSRQTTTLPGGGAV